MATPSNGASVDDVLEDLQLHEVILQSLDEQRPDASQERDEIMDTIRDLQTQLAQLRGQPLPTLPSLPSLPTLQDDSSSSRLNTPASFSGMHRTQLDGSGFDVSPFDDSPPDWGRAPTSTPPSRSSGADRSRVPFPVRKRPHVTELSSDDMQPPPMKRVQADDLLRPSSSGAESTESEQFDDGADELRRLLGLDNEDTMTAFRDEQRKAEEWLQDRKDQERRDAEYARMLHDGLYEQPRPASGSSSTSYSGSSLPFPTSPAPEPSITDKNQPFYNQPAPAISRPIKTPSPLFAQGGPVDPRHPPPALRQPVPQYPPPLLKRQSDDNDIEEITKNDFHPRDRLPSYPHAHPAKPDSSSSLYMNSREPPRILPWNDKPAPLPYHHHSYLPFEGAPGPTGLPGPGQVYGPSVLQNTMARLNAGRHMLEAGKSMWGGLPGVLPSQNNPYAFPRPADPISRTMDHAINHGSMDNYSSMDYLNDLYESGGDPKKINEEIKQLLENIRPDAEVSQQEREGTPEALKVTLLEHQKLGLAWMKSMEESEQKSGILADDMGLGKTIQALALMVARPSTDPERKTTLVIAPVALMQQWKREIERLLRPGRHQLSIFVLHGDKRSSAFRELKAYDVVLTTFGTLASELKRKEKYEELHKQSGSSEPLPRAVINSLPCLGPTSKWYRVIIDEAQCIKNRNTKSALAACALDSIHRWCMSGTPMMNNVEELHSLLKFLRIRPYSSLERFNRDFTRPLKGGPAEQSKAMKQLQVLLKAVLLRRTKTSKIDGKPILQLPPRVSEKVHAVFSEDEQELYNSVESKTQLQFNKYLKAGTVGRNYSSILVLLLRLRQACCHPHLMSDFSVSVETNANTNEVDLVANAQAFGSDVVIRLKDNDNVECPICIDAVENPIIFFPCGHGTCAECYSRISDPSLAVQQGHDGTIEVKCPNCRGRVDTKKITNHATFKKVHFPDESDESEPLASEKPAEQEADETDSDSDDDDDDDDLSRFIVKDDDTGKAKGKGKKPNKPKKKTLAELKKEGMRNQKAKGKYLRRLEKSWVSSAKIDKTVDILQEIQDRDDGEKTIIFSQFTSLLDLLEVPIARRGWGYRRYDGSMRPPDRNAAVLDFTDKPDCKIMLVSLKAGNSGLNLVAASQVIIFDPFWNPYIEEQAIDRAHRIGQQRQVQIHRILVEKTVEDRILELQDKKRELIEGALDENASKSVSRLGTRELGYLFGVRV